MHQFFTIHSVSYMVFSPPPTGRGAIGAGELLKNTGELGVHGTVENQRRSRCRSSGKQEEHDTNGIRGRDTCGKHDVIGFHGMGLRSGEWRLGFEERYVGWSVGEGEAKCRHYQKDVIPRYPRRGQESNGAALIRADFFFIVEINYYLLGFKLKRWVL